MTSQRSFDQELALEQRLAAARDRNQATASCNGRRDCTADSHIIVCLSQRPPAAPEEPRAA